MRLKNKRNDLQQRKKQFNFFIKKFENHDKTFCEKIYYKVFQFKVVFVGRVTK